MKSQKEAVVELVKRTLSTFVPYKDIALVMLTKDQLEDIKTEVCINIMNAVIEYSKPLNKAEVVTYARSMVMNHLKKAKELNGNQVYTTNPGASLAKAEAKALLNIDISILPEDLQEFVKTLV